MAGGEGAAIARHVHDFLCSYAPAHLTSSGHTLRGYRTALSLYMEWLEGLGVTPPALAADDFSQPRVEAWLRWLSDERATPYMLRHAYAIENINALVGRGFDGLDDLELLSKSMGHVSVDVTARDYYALVPSLAALMQGVSDPGFDDVVPEVL